MVNSVFLDTNIILDFLDSKRKHHNEAKTLFEVLILNDYEVFISEDILSTIYYIHKDKPTVLRFFQAILEQWIVVPYTTELISKAIQICLDQGEDLEDALQCLCAKEHDCRYLITNDKRFLDCGIEVIGYDFGKL